MSDPEKDKKNPETQTEEIADAVLIEEDTPQEDPVELAEPEAGEPPSDEDEPETDSDGDEIVDAVIEDSPEPEPEKTTPPPPAPAEPARQAGFVPLVLGGIVAAGLGFGASRLVFPDGWPGTGNDDAVQALTSQLQQQAQTVATLEQRLTSQENKPVPTADLTPAIEAAQAAQKATDSLVADLAALDTRLSALEKAPAEGGANAAAVEAYEREVRTLRDLMEKQKAEVDALVAAAEQDKASAETTAQQAMIRSAVARIQIALDTGKGFSDAVADLVAGGVTVPAPLAAVAENGVATPAKLAADYPAAARKALAAARKSEGSGGNIWTFLRNQVGMRSLEPKEGADADAILSRAEAALADGRLTDTLAELQGLPEEARVELTDWMAAATQRTEALSAAEDLTAQLASN